MRLGLTLPLVTTAADLNDTVALAVAADELGFDVAWAAEAYGSDAPTVLASIAARTQRIGIGSGVMQIPARTPAMTAMTAATLDALSGGRFRLGLGVSGPQVSEGWHGVGFADPLGRTEEYLRVVRMALGRKRVAVDGKHFTLPLPDGQGKPLMLSLAPVRKEIPIYLAAVGPKNLTLTGRIADGWLGIFFDADTGAGHVETITTAASGAGRDPATLDIAVQAPLSLGSDPVAAADRLRGYAALYIGGMGSKKVNFYHGIATSMGYGVEADQVQERFMSRDYAGAAAAVPAEFLDRTCLLGDPERVTARLAVLGAAGVTTVNLSPFGSSQQEKVEALRTVITAARQAGLLSA